MNAARFLTAALFCVVVSTSVVSTSIGAPAPGDKDDLNALRARIGSLKSELDQKETSRRESRDALHESERAISDAGRELRSLEAQTQAAQDELKLLTAKRRELGAGLELQ